MSEHRIPDRLRREVLTGLEPVRPLPQPAVRALEVSLWAVALFLAIPAIFPLRADAAILGWLLTWGAAAAESVTGVVLVGLALREAVPGSGIGRARSLAALAAGLAVHATVGLLTWARGSASGEIAVGLHAGARCFTMQGVLALPALALGFWLVVRAMPVRPPWAGALAGLGAALMADGVWHLICPSSDLQHLLVWHGGATVLITATGWALGALWQRRQESLLRM